MPGTNHGSLILTITVTLCLWGPSRYYRHLFLIPLPYGHNIFLKTLVPVSDMYRNLLSQICIVRVIDQAAILRVRCCTIVIISASKWRFIACMIWLKQTQCFQLRSYKLILCLLFIFKFTDKVKKKAYGRVYSVYLSGLC